jgi:hypothetical protein
MCFNADMLAFCLKEKEKESMICVRMIKIRWVKKREVVKQIGNSKFQLHID